METAPGKARFPTCPLLGRRELHMLQRGDTPAGDRKVASLYMTLLAPWPRRLGSHDVQRGSAKPQTLPGPCMFHLGGLPQTPCPPIRQQAQCRRTTFSEEIFFTFDFLNRRMFHEMNYISIAPHRIKSMAGQRLQPWHHDAFEVLQRSLLLLWW